MNVIENFNATPTPRDKTLERADWLAAALDCLCESGVEGVKITTLAQRLQVTRGSFYWHFKDRGDILASILDVWRQKNTANLIKAADTGTGPQDAVLAIFECWMNADLYDPKLDLAIRAWARLDPNVAQEMRGADQARLHALTVMYQKDGLTDKQAIVAARNLYYMQMGYYALDVTESVEERLAHMPNYYQSYCGRALAPELHIKFSNAVRERLAR